MSSTAAVITTFDALLMQRKHRRRGKSTKGFHIIAIHRMLRYLFENGLDGLVSNKQLYYSAKSFSYRQYLEFLHRLEDCGAITTDKVQKGKVVFIFHTLTEKGKIILYKLDKLNEICNLEKIVVNGYYGRRGERVGGGRERRNNDVPDYF